MDEQSSPRVGVPACRWRTSSETLDVIEALERIESLLIRIDQRLQQTEQPAPSRVAPIPAPDPRRLSDARS
jgi:hypothetical protein